MDDENISVTRTNSTLASRCSSTYRSRSRSPPPPPDDEGVLNLDTKSAKIVTAAVDESPSFDEDVPRPPSEQQSRLDEVFQSSVEHLQQGSKQKSKKYKSVDNVEPLAVPHEENGFENGLEPYKNTKGRRNAHKDDSTNEIYVGREKPIILPRGYIDPLDLFKGATGNFPIPSLTFPHPNADTVRLYQPYLYPFQQLHGNDHTHSLFASNFMAYQHHPQLFTESYRKELLKVTSPTSPSRTSPPKTGAQLYPGPRVEPVLPNQPSVAPIH